MVWIGGLGVLVEGKWELIRRRVSWGEFDFLEDTLKLHGRLSVFWGRMIFL